MKKHLIIFTLVFAAVSLSVNVAFAQSTLPLSPEEREAIYSATITKRTTAILEHLALNNPARSNIVHAQIMAYYRALRARDGAFLNQ